MEVVDCLQPLLDCDPSWIANHDEILCLYYGVRKLAFCSKECLEKHIEFVLTNRRSQTNETKGNKMKTIRNSVFETNSSSCHVVTVLSDYEMEKLKNNELLLDIHLSQSSKTITTPIDERALRYELEQCQCVHDNNGQLKYIDLDMKTVESLSKELWDLLISNMKKRVDGLEEKVKDIVKKYSADENFIESVWYRVEGFASDIDVEYILEKMQKYEMASGENMNFSCVEMEC